MTIYSDNYAFDFYKWAHDIECAEKVAKEMVERVIKKVQKADRKALILLANQTKDYSNYPDSDSDESITTKDFNEIHQDEKKTKWFACFKLKIFKKRKYSHTL
jgi:hypothetical protein